MRSATLISLLSMATIFACANSRFTGIADGGPSDSGASTTRADSSTKKDGGDEEEEETDSGKKPTKSDAGDPPTACSPGDVSGFSPSWTPPTTLHQGACSATQVSTLIDCLFNPSSNQTTCDSFLQATGNTSCLECAITDSGAASYGPMVLTGQLVSLNIAGCIARTSNQVTSTGCGAKVQAVSQCTGAACEANCPVPDGDAQALQDRNDCETAAESGDCSTYATDAQCADSLLQGASADCAAGSTFEDVASGLVTLFCGN